MSNSHGRNGRPWRRLRQTIIDTSDGICAWCHQPVNRQLPGTHPDGPTVDHTWEITDGGPRTDPANLRLMHRRCNEAKERERRRRPPGNTSRPW